MISNFVPIKGYEEYYGVSPNGEVYSTYTGILLKHGMGDGYPKVILYRPGKRPKTHTIHRLLAEHFIPNPNDLPQVNHKDGDRGNFSLDNLEWITNLDNVKDGYKRGRKNWNAGKELVDRSKVCEFCKQEFKYKKKHQRFCGNSCSAKGGGAIELFKSGVLTKEIV